MKYFTWNTQGKFQDPDKWRVIKRLFSSGCAVGFIQEGGVNPSSALMEIYEYSSGRQVGSFNERCTNYVIWNPGAFLANTAPIKFEIGTGGGVAGRRGAGVRVGDQCFVSWHSLSAASNLDTSDLLRDISKSFPSSRTVVGGDFNTDPKSLREVLFRQEVRVPVQMELQIPPGPTHKSGDTLDYFVAVGPGATRCTSISVEPVLQSDHDPVVMELHWRN